ncbi:hypothetical protein [Sphingomonas qomolangmaensis]|uniref:Lipoprotein n=1 Tax=Sphingomonas qomolangmaensis TaxID=2918765 RepID=A0ABY5LB25_9SPHN|nr:hypothetical protein [Sphingomonas qomolangmaensis]UUL83967.1 hypothetical protein NMP03_07190 [Sphingomonas qomolangmaensis]
MTKVLKMGRKTLCAVFLLTVPALVGCCLTGRPVVSENQGWPDAGCRRLGDDYKVDPVRTIDSGLKMFRENMLPQARNTGRRFPGYSTWMTEVGEAIRRHEETEATDASSAAQAEFDQWTPKFNRPPFSLDQPQIQDMEKVAAIKAQTEFRLMAKSLTGRLRCQTDDTREAAANHFYANYKIDD